MNKLSWVIIGFSILVSSCKKDTAKIPCTQFLRVTTIDSLTGDIVPGVEIRPEIGYPVDTSFSQVGYSDDHGKFLVGQYSFDCLAKGFRLNEVFWSFRKHYFKKFYSSDGPILEDTAEVDLMVFPMSRINISLFDSTGVSNHCFDFSTVQESDLASISSSSLADTTFPIYVLPDREIKIRWYTHAELDPSVTVPLPMDTTQPQYYTIYGDTVLTLEYEEEVSLMINY